MVEALERAGVRGVQRWELEYLERACVHMMRVDRVLDEQRGATE